jgi:Family of unknown function (DUF5723)
MKKLAVILSVVVLASFSSFAQFGSTGAVGPRSTSMAKTYNAISRGVYAIGINPSNLVYEDNYTMELATVLPIPYFSVRTGTDFASLDQIKYYFGGVNGNARVLNDQDKQNFSNLFQGGGYVFTNFSTNWFTLTYNANPEVGAFAFSVNDFAGGKFYFPQGIVDIALNGNPAGREYNINDLNVNMWWIRNYSFSYAREIKGIDSPILDKLSAGVTFKLVNGYAYAGTKQINTSFTTAGNGVITGNANFDALSAFSSNFNVKYDFDSVKTNNAFSPFPSPAGHGFGLDLGVSAVLNKYWHVSAAVTDIGNITWDQNTAEFSANGNIYVDDIASQSQRDSLKNQIVGKSQSIGSFSTALPTALRLGASYFFDNDHNPIPGTLLLALDYNQGFNNQPGNSTIGRVSWGLEWNPGSWLPYVRTGISVGGSTGFHWGAGLGFGAGLLEFDLGTSDLQDVVAPTSAKYLSFSMGSRWRF